MKVRLFIFLLSFAFHYSVSAQKSTAIKPQSIYAISHILTGNSTYSNLNQQLKLTDYQFVFVDQLDLDINQFSIEMRNFGRKPTQWIHDDYLKYRDENLLKGFRLKYDPTRWNLQCGNPRAVYIK